MPVLIRKGIAKSFPVLLFFLLLMFNRATAQHSVFFCGERIPLEKSFVADKLMNVIRKQVPLVNMKSLRARTETYFPIVVKYLKLFNIPEDLKYLPIVESAFMASVRSHAGAHGFWQIMPATAAQYGMIMNDVVDEREDIFKASEVGCKLLRFHYDFYKKRYQVGSWVLAAAAYNNGIGNIDKAIKRQGTDYFSMNLNPETAAYVYKIIAVKELFEYPEIYIKNFGYNVFATDKPVKVKPGGDENDAAFSKIQLDVSETEAKSLEVVKPAKYIPAKIIGSYKKFKDGNLVKIELEQDMTTPLGFSKKGYTFSVPGWIIDDRVFVDLGYGHELTLCDMGLQKGIALSELKGKKTGVMLRNTGYSD